MDFICGEFPDVVLVCIYHLILHLSQSCLTFEGLEPAPYLSCNWDIFLICSSMPDPSGSRSPSEKGLCHLFGRKSN